MATIFNDPTITDISRISTTMASLKSLSFVIAFALVGLLTPMEVIHQNIKAIEGRNGYTSLFVRLGLVFVGILLYDQIFNFFVKTSTIIEWSILSEDKWSDLLAQLAQFFKTRKLTLISSLPLVFTWIASFLALLAQSVMFWVRYCLLSVLYFVGPIAFTFNIFEPTAFLPKAWFKNVIQLSLWPVVMKIIVRVMLELQVMTYLASANSNLDILTLIGINTTFVVMVVLSPYFTDHFISGQTFGPFAVMASTYISTKTASILKGAGGAVMRSPIAPTPRNLGRAIATTKTALRERILSRNGDRP